MTINGLTVDEVDRRILIIADVQRENEALALNLRPPATFDSFVADLFNLIRIFKESP